ncbi:hypothetical protein A2U94_19490 [Bacillus sp. VT 712]|nr:hypothetical protein A2U94_19490 [Bacillus sp. VT 712]
MRLTCWINFYNSIEGLPSHSFSVFKNRDVEAIRLSSIAGEIYQAVRRVARDNPNTVRIYVVNDNQDVMNMVREQMPNIQYYMHQIHLNKSADSEKQKVQSLKSAKVKMAKEIIIKSKESGDPFINKRDIRVKLDIKSSPNFTQILSELETFLDVNKIENIGQKLVFT